MSFTLAQKQKVSLISLCLSSSNKSRTIIIIIIIIVINNLFIITINGIPQTKPPFPWTNSSSSPSLYFALIPSFYRCDFFFSSNRNPNYTDRLCPLVWPITLLLLFSFFPGKLIPFPPFVIISRQSLIF